MSKCWPSAEFSCLLVTLQKWDVKISANLFRVILFIWRWSIYTLIGVFFSWKTVPQPESTWLRKTCDSGPVTRFQATQALKGNSWVQPEALLLEYIKKCQNMTGLLVELFHTRLQCLPRCELARRFDNYYMNVQRLVNKSVWCDAHQTCAVLTMNEDSFIH